MSGICPGPELVVFGVLIINVSLICIVCYWECWFIVNVGCVKIVDQSIVLDQHSLEKIMVLCLIIGVSSLLQS